MLQYMKAVAKLGKDLDVARGNAAEAQHMKVDRATIETAVQNICNDVVTMLEEHLLHKAEEPESRIFYYKL